MTLQPTQQFRKTIFTDQDILEFSGKIKEFRKLLTNYKPYGFQKAKYVAKKEKRRSERVKERKSNGA
jgi:hypothetical protein